MIVKLDDLELVAHMTDSADSSPGQLRVINNLKVDYDRRLLFSKVVSADGMVTADAGRYAAKIYLSGMFIGDEALQGMRLLEDKHRAAQPFQFVSDLTILSAIRNVLIEVLAISVTSGKKNNYYYEMILREYNEPTEIEAAPSQDKEAESEVDQNSDLRDILVEVITKDGELVRNAKVLIRGAGKEIRSQTDDDGLVKILDVAEGKYEILVEDDERFKDVRQEVEIKKKNS
jgi:hypothetical protein